MYDLLKNIAEDNNWVFNYSPNDEQNLYDEMTEQNKIHLFVDPIETDSKFTNSGNESKTFNGSFMLLVSSDFDETYSTRYTDHIKPIADNALQTVKDAIICGDYNIGLFRTIEAINIYDYNLDGIIITYSITEPK